MCATCFHCGGTVVWDNDFTGDEVYGNGDENGIVHTCHCANCGAEIEYYIKGEDFENDG